MRDQTYWPKLLPIQAAGPNAAAIIDPLAQEIDIGALLRAPEVAQTVKVLHAARQDIEIFYHQGGVIPHPLFDTQIAAMVCGFGDAASYETLARRIAPHRDRQISPVYRLERRPLSDRQPNMRWQTSRT